LEDQGNLGLKQAHLAARLQVLGWEIDRAGVSKIESQLIWVSDFQMLYLGEALKIPPVELLPKLDPAKRWVIDAMGGHAFSVTPALSTKAAASLRANCAKGTKSFATAPKTPAASSLRKDPYHSDGLPASH
jgi:hypothetical protein